MFPLWIAALGNVLKQKEDAEQARKGAAADVSGQFSASQGMPQYQLEAAKTNRAIELGKGAPDYLSMYMQSQQGRKRAQ